MIERCYQELFNVVKNYPEFSGWRSQGTYEIRDTDNKLSLTPFGLKDWRSDTIEESLVAIARRLDIDLESIHPDFKPTKPVSASPQSSGSKPKTTNSKRGTELSDVKPKITEKEQALINEVQAERKKVSDYYDAATGDLQIAHKYLATRSITVSDKVLKSIGIRTSVRPSTNGSENDCKRVYEVIIPIRNVNRDLIKLQRVGLNSEFKKIYKKQLGKGTEDAATTFGTPDSKEVFITEGLEDALSVYQERHTDTHNVACIISHGASNFKKLDKLIKRVVSAIGQSQAKYIAILDNDSNNVSLEASRALPAFIERRISVNNQDANKALAQGSFETWYESLRVITKHDYAYIDSIKAVKDSSVYKDHRDFFLSLFYDIKKDVVSDTLCIKLTKDGEWQNIENQIDYIRSAARTQFIKGDDGKLKPKYTLSAFKEHVDFYSKQEAKTGLLISVPQWDGIDRIAMIADKINSKAFSKDEIYQILREWCVKTWLRVFDTTTEQHFLLLIGPQGTGKDVLIRALTNGYGDYAQQPALSGDETKTCRSVTELIVANVAEFDKLKFENVALLKDIITKPALKFDQKYTRGDIKAKNRCSFIGSANTQYLLRDHTGNRRYRILPFESIELKRNSFGFIEECNNYPGDDLDPNKRWNQAQLVAQYKAMSESASYQVDLELKQKIDGLIGDLTPQNEADEIEITWFDKINHKVDHQINEYNSGAGYDGLEVQTSDRIKWKWIKNHGLINIADCGDIIKAIGAETGLKPNIIKLKLKEKGISDSNARTRQYPGRGRVKGLYSIKSGESVGSLLGTLHGEVKSEDPDPLDFIN